MPRMLVGTALTQLTRTIVRPCPPNTKYRRTMRQKVVRPGEQAPAGPCSCSLVAAGAVAPLWVRRRRSVPLMHSPEVVRMTEPVVSLGISLHTGSPAHKIQRQPVTARRKQYRQISDWRAVGLVDNCCERRGQ